MLTQGELERERNESRLKAARDRLSFFKDAFEEGFEQGLEMGKFIESIRISQHRLNRPLTPRDELMSLPLDELRRQADALEMELFGS
jgi:hypothetical protein